MPLVAAVAAVSGDNTVVAAVTGKKIRVTRFELSASAAANVKWRTGSTDITGLFYLTTTSPVARSSATVDANDFLFETVAGAALVLNSSTAGPVGGFVNYTQET